MKQQKRNSEAIAGGADAPSLSELRAIRLEQRATTRRVEDLKMRLFRMTEQHMDQAVNLIRRWLDDKTKK